MFLFNYKNTTAPIVEIGLDFVLIIRIINSYYLFDMTIIICYIGAITIGISIICL